MKINNFLNVFPSLFVGKVSKFTMLRYLEQLEKSEFGKVLCEKKGREHFYSLEAVS